MSDVSFPQTVLNKSEGVNRSEQFLNKLADKTFLSLWSYPSLYNDKGVTVCKQTGAKKGEGKELCDLLVIFDNTILIFSVKEYQFQQDKDIAQSWIRWYRGAIAGAAKQIYGAERWLEKFPQRIYLDKATKTPFPYPLPSQGNAIVHRIVVAFGASEAHKQYCCDATDGNLAINTAIKGDMHVTKDSLMPFVIGDIDESKGFIHIFNEDSLDAIMSTLNTTPDFIKYLSDKEKFLRGNNVVAKDEKDILSYYLLSYDERINEHCFPNVRHNKVVFDNDIWDEFCKRPERIRQLEANEISYFWDGLIEAFIKPVTTGTAYQMSHPTIAEQEFPFRIMVKENRTMRRTLSKNLIGLIEHHKKFCEGHTILRPSTRMMYSPNTGVCYLFQVLQCNDFYETYEIYRERKQMVLNGYLHVAKLKLPDAQQLIGIGIEINAIRGGGSEDFAYLDASQWNDADIEYATKLEKCLIDMGFIGERNARVESVFEYPLDTLH